MVSTVEDYLKFFKDTSRFLGAEKIAAGKTVTEFEEDMR